MQLESREPCFTAVCWFLHKLNPEMGEAAAVMVNSRDPRARRLVLMASGAGTVQYEGHAVGFAVHTSPPLATEGKPEPFRRLTLTGTEAVIAGLMGAAVDAYRAFVAGPDAAGGGGEVPYWAWDPDASAWRRGVPRPHRSMDTLYLTEDARALVDDFRRFRLPANLARYRDLHVAPTRVYMLHGRPGSGKTSTVQCLASELGMGVATFDCCDSDADLKAALESLPGRCLLRLEDVDSMFDGRKALAGITFAGLLAALDSIHHEGTGVFLTTNRLCSLDPALRRRVDYVLEFGDATRDQARRMVARFFPQADFEAFWEAVRPRTFSMSALQKYLVKCLHAGDPLRDIRQFGALVDIAKAEDGCPGMYC